MALARHEDVLWVEREPFLTARLRLFLAGSRSVWSQSPSHAPHSTGTQLCSHHEAEAPSSPEAQSFPLSPQSRQSSTSAPWAPESGHSVPRPPVSPVDPETPVPGLRDPTGPGGSWGQGRLNSAPSQGHGPSWSGLASPSIVHTGLWKRKRNVLFLNHLKLVCI